MIDNIYNNISEEDIAILNKYGETLGDTLQKFGGDIDNLKAYVKWLYKYGGTGSKYGGSGSGDGSGTSKWSIIASIDSQSINNGNLLLDNTKKTHTLNLTINRPGSGIYNVSVKYNDVSIPLSGSSKVTLSAENNTYTTQIELNGNNKVFVVNATEMTEMDTKVLQTTCIINPVDFKLSLVKNDNRIININNNSLYLNDINENDGFNVKINHELFIAAEEININYTIVGPRTINGVINLGAYGLNTDTNNKYTLFNLYDLFIKNKSIDDSVGYYAIVVKLSYNYNGNHVDELSTSFTLLPSGIFLSVIPSIKNAIIYKEDPTDNISEDEYDNVINNVYKFNNKNSVFKLTGYLGSEHLGQNTLQLSITINDYTFNSTLINNVQTNVILNLNGSKDNVEKNIVKFKVSNPVDSTKTQEYTYYIFVNKQDNTIDWFPIVQGTNDRIIPTLTSNFRFNNIIEDDKHLLNNLYSVNKDFSTNGYIEFNNTDEFVLYNANSGNIFNERATDDFMISFGIQYSEVNKTENKIMTISLSNNINIDIYQDKIKIGEQGYQIYIPEEENYDPSDRLKYNLFTIYKRKLTEDNSDYVDKLNSYELILYLNGELEQGIGDSYLQNKSGITVSTITIYEGNYSFNLFDISYFEHPGEFDKNYVRKYLNDIDITQYYYNYKKLSYDIPTEDFNNELNNFLILYNNIAPLFKTVDYINSTDLEEINTSVIKLDNIANKEFFEKNLFAKNEDDKPTITYDIPIAVLNINLTDSSEEGAKNFFINFFTKSYSESSLNTAGSYRISIDWYKEGESHSQENVNIDNDIIFTLKLQGSSTGEFKSKNFNITSSSTSGDNSVILWTPNFEKDNYDSFLPEETFTFKADVVDSTHANNTSIGLFVNKNTTKFADAQVNNSKYSRYIKNCLLGFPVLIFFKLNNEYYYMGVYNCNLGRDSLLNLGYYDIHNALDYAIDNDSSTITLNNGFGIYRIDKHNYQPISENGEVSLSVAEIQGGSNYFDFSQYDDTILFDTVNENGQIMLNGMFGDYYPSNEQGIRNTKQKIKKLVEGISYAGGYLFNYIGKNFSEDESDNYGYTYGYRAHRISNDINYWTESINGVPNYRHVFKQRVSGNNGKEYVHVGLNDHIGEITDVFTLLGYNSSEDEQIDITKYKHNAPNTFYRLLDYTSIVEYYTICMGFGLVDSVMKNLNLKSFKESGPFYAAFYDMDTALGRDNGGAEVSPFAFSDYWTKLNGMDIIYRDFYPNKEEANNSGENKIPTGYDVPSSYLFAIAKYANLLGITKTPGFTTAPKSIWAKFRQNSNSVLANADTFINNYFGINLDKIPKFMFNMNYRFKYFQRRKNAFDSKNKLPFHGRGKYYLKNWLSKRLHLLDAYFNIIDFNNPFKIYDKTTNKWTDKLTNPDDPNSQLLELNINNIVADGNISLTNTDIYILKNIFTNELNSGVALNGGGQSSTIRALEYSPMIFRWPQAALFFLCLDQNTNYFFSGPATDSGNLKVTFGGSIAWTYSETLSPFIDEAGKLTLDNAKYLENINIPNGNLQELNLNNVKSLKDITITSRNAKCSLDGKLDGNSNYPNLRKIDLHNSGCTLTIMNSPVKEINLSNVNSESTTSIAQALNSKVYSITQCNNLSSVKLNNMYAKSLNINPVWSDNVEISDSGIKELQLTANAAKYPESTISILNNEYVEKVVLTDFKHINIENCPKLKDIVVLQSNIKVETLHIIGCNRAVFDDKSTEYIFENNLLNIYIDNVNNNVTNTDGTIDLELLSNLKNLSLNNTLGFKHIYLPDANVILDQYCFANTQLNKLSRHTIDYYHDVIAIIGGDSIFMNTKYTFDTDNVKDNDNSMKAKFGILNTVQSMENMFAHNDGLKYEANEIMTSMFSFIDNLVIFEDNDTKSDNFSGPLTFVQNVAGMFYNQNISIKFDNNYTDDRYNGLLSRLTNVTNVSNMFFGNKDFNVLTKEMLGNFCTNITDNLDLTDFIPNLKYIKKDTFWNLLPKINGNFITSKSYPVTLTVVSNIDNIELAEVKLLDIFTDPDNPVKQTKVTSICGLNFTNATLDFENLFDYLPNLKTIVNSFGSTGITNIAKNLNSCHLKKLDIIQITNSFLFSGVDDRVDLYNFLNWEKIEILGSQENRDKPDLLLFDKSITQENFVKIGEEISFTEIDYIFQQCAFDNNNSNQFIIPESYSKITSINHTFKKISMIVGDNYNAPVKLSTETFPINHQIKNMDYAFYGITLEEGLCTNLFNLRTDDNFTYKKQILSMQYCFANIIVKSNPWWVLKDGESYDQFGLNTPNGYINCSPIDSKTSYIAVDNNAKIYIYDDNNNVRNTIFNITDTSTKLINFDINNQDYGGLGAENHYILPYDIFYASANGGCKIDSCFGVYDNIYDSGHFIGVLPDNLFNPNMRDVNNYNKENKSNLYIVSLSDVFKNLFIIPNKLNTEALYENNEDNNINRVIKTNIYVYIPKHFFNFDRKPLSYSNAFSFIINFPEDTFINNKFSYNMCYLLYEDTFNESMTSFENIFALTYYPLVYTDNHGGIQYQSTQIISRYSYNVRIGYMINDDMYLKAKEGIEVKTLNSNNEYEIVKQPITRILYDGIDIKKYLNTYNVLNGAFNSNMLDIMMGYMIRPKHYNSIEKTLEEYMINTMGTGGYVAQGSSIYTLYLSISKFILFTRLNNRLDIIKFIMGGLSMNSNVNLYSYQTQPGYVRVEYDMNNNEIELPNIQNTYEFTINDTSYIIQNSLFGSLPENSIDINDIIEDPIILYWKEWNKNNN